MIRVAITDDHQLIIQGIFDILNASDQVEVIGSFLTAKETMDGIEELNPDVLLLDINLPDGDGVALCKDIKKILPSVEIIALTTFNQTILVKNMIKNGAKGYLLKNTSLDELVEAITAVHNGEQFLQPDIKEALLAESLGNPRRESYIPKLTRREKEVLTLVMEEMTTQEIAEKLFISPKTVESHRLSLIQKMGVRNTAGLVKEAINKGLLD